jgi:predicted Rossmann-fold nucleotide-binding protein
LKENCIKTISSLEGFLKNGNSLKDSVVQDIDFSKLNINWDSVKVDNTTFMGCEMSIEEEITLRRKGVYIYMHPKDTPFNPYRNGLYTWRELMEGWTPEKDESVDLKIYESFSSSKYNPSINEALCQRIHDNAIDEALRKLVGYDGKGMTDKKCVAFMGGHSTRRDDEWFIKTAKTAKLLGEQGYFVVSGGGPGIMEATNLGAYFAGKGDDELNYALKILEKAPHYTNPDFNARAMEVLEKFPEGAESLAIPTWFYGHEPSNLFASHIAKYFSNSIREDTLLAVALYGIVFSPGSAGTTQEIFQDATQNHYGTFDYLSPMVFFSRKRYEVDTMIYPLLRQLAYGKEYADMLHLTDEPEDVLAFLEGHPPRKMRENKA